MLNITKHVKKVLLFFFILNTANILKAVNKSDVGEVFEQLRSRALTIEALLDTTFAEDSIYDLAKQFLSSNKDKEKKLKLIDKIIDYSEVWYYFRLDSPYGRFQETLDELEQSYKEDQRLKNLVSEIRRLAKERSLYYGTSIKIKMKWGFIEVLQRAKFVQTIEKLSETQFIRLLYIFFMCEVAKSFPCKLTTTISLSSNLVLATLVVVIMRILSGDTEEHLYRELTETPYATPPSTPEKPVTAGPSKVEDSPVRRALFRGVSISAATQTDGESHSAGEIAIAPGGAAAAGEPAKATT